MVRKIRTTRKTSEVVKSLQLIGCSYCKALTLNLLHKLLPILTLLPGGDDNQQVRNRGMKCIGAAATRPVELNMWSCW
jgi:hypothetical protein